MKHLRNGLELIVLFVLWLIAIVVVNGIPSFIIFTVKSLPLTAGSDFINYPWFTLLSHISSVIGTLLAVYFFFLLFGGKLKEIGFSPKGRVKDIGWGLLYGAGTILTGFLILRIFGLISIEKGSVGFMTMFICLISMFFAAAMEEILCRGAMINICLKYQNRAVAVIIPALIFSVMHIFNNGFDWISCGNIFLAGIFMGIYYVFHRNLWLPTALHVAWNYVQGPVLGFAVSGAHTPQMITQHQYGSELWTGGAFGFEGSLLGLILLSVASVILYFHFRKGQNLKSEPKPETDHSHD